MLRQASAFRSVSQVWSVSASSRIGREIDPSWSSTSRSQPATITIPSVLPSGRRLVVVDGGGLPGAFYRTARPCGGRTLSGYPSTLDQSQTHHGRPLAATVRAELCCAPPPEARSHAGPPPRKGAP